jgi:protein-S-isoprenylcysteine O-methyltransferase Ste14
MVPVGIISAWFRFLLLPIPWWLSWIVCIIIFTISFYILVLSKKEFDRSGQKLTPNAQGTSKLMTDGIYSIIRHPHNLASVFLIFGIAFMFKSIIGLIIALVFLGLGYWLTLEEEKLLIQQFGDKYLEYQVKVPMFIPKLKKS